MPDLPYDKLTLIPLLVVAVYFLYRDSKEKDKTIAESLRILERAVEATEHVADVMERDSASAKQSLPKH